MKNLKLFMLAVFAMVSMIFATASMAQTSTTGTVEGTVTDQNGAVVSGATVTLSGPNLIRDQTATSDSSGNYRFSQVPPGRYTVSTSPISGFSAYKQENLEVNLTRATTANITLTTAVSGVVDVVASAEIDQATNTTGSNISTEFFSNIPTSRTVQGLYTIAPTVARSGLRDASGRDRDPSVAGSSGPENSYILDGVNTTDPAFGGGGANLPFEFVQEVQIKTGAFGADQGLSTGGVFNVITKSGGNEFHGDLFAFGLPKGFVRSTKNFPFTGIAPNGYSELDAGGDIGGPIVKNRLTFFAAFNPQYRKNQYLTQTFREDVEGKVKTPFYSGKISWVVSNSTTATFSTFGDFTKEEGFLFSSRNDLQTGFGANPEAFQGTRETGGHNYAARVNSNINNNMIGEFAFGLHYQRNNVLPLASQAAINNVTDNFAIVTTSGGVATVAPITQTGFNANAGFTSTTNLDIRDALGNQGRSGFVDYVFAPGGSLQRNYTQNGFGLYQDQDRNRMEFSARLQNIWAEHTFKYGFEFYRNKYDIFQTATGSAQTFDNPLGLRFAGGEGNNVIDNARITNNYYVCTTRVVEGTPRVVCPQTQSFGLQSGATRSDPVNLFNTLPANLRPAGFTADAIVGTLTQEEFLNNPFLIRNNTRVRAFTLDAKTRSDVQSFYVQDDYKPLSNLQITMGARWDLQQGYGNNDVQYFKLNNLWDDFQPRLGISWDPSKSGRSKIFANFARYVETPLPLDINVRAGSQDSQTDKNFQADRLNGVGGATLVPGIRAFGTCQSIMTPASNVACNIIDEFGHSVRNPDSFLPGSYLNRTSGAVNLGADPTPIDAGLKPQTVNEFTLGFEHQFRGNYTFGARGIYRAQGSVIEDGSFDDGDTYFLFNPGEPLGPGPGGEFGNTEYNACLGSINDPSDPDDDRAPACFGRARRYYRALEFTLNRRFANNFSFNTSYVYSSLIGNYEGLFRNDNQQSDPNITSLFDLVSLLNNTYGRLPNDRPHQFKFNGSYTTPWRLVISGNFYAQSGTPFNQLIPHPVYGNNEGFAVPRGTAIVPDTTSFGGAGGVESAIGSTRTPTTWNLDLGFYYPIRFSENKQLRLTADWFNVTDSQRAVTLDQTYQINSGASGVAPVLNPFYGTGLVFQYPSAFRVGAKFSF